MNGALFISISTSALAKRRLATDRLSLVAIWWSLYSCSRSLPVWSCLLRSVLFLGVGAPVVGKYKTSLANCWHVTSCTCTCSQSLDCSHHHVLNLFPMIRSTHFVATPTHTHLHSSWHHVERTQLLSGAGAIPRIVLLLRYSLQRALVKVQPSPTPHLA